MNLLKATELKLKCLQMVEGTDLEWFQVMRMRLSTVVSQPREWDFSADEEYYEIAATIVEGTPLWIGDTYYSFTGEQKTVSIHHPSYHSDYWKSCTLSRPAPRVIMVPIYLSDAKAMSESIGSVSGAMFLSRISEACEKAVREENEHP